MRSRQRLIRFVLGSALVAALMTPGYGQANQRAVHVCTLNWEPFVAADLPREGFLNALTRASFNAVGREMNMEFMPWPRAMLEVKQGDRDMVQASYFNETRDENYRLTDPIYPTKVGLVALKSIGIHDYDSLRELKGYTIGLSRGFTTSPEFDEADYLEKRPNKNNRLNVKKLYKGRLDMIAMNLDRFIYLAKDEGFDTDRAVFIGEPLAKQRLYLMASLAIPDSKQIVSDFNRGLKKIRKNGTYDQILEDMGYAR